MSPEFWLQAGAVGMFLAVALGAFAAHGLKARLSPEMLTIFETGVRYHVYHALALVALGAARGPEKAGWCFIAGIVVFSGSLYVLALTGEKRLGMITPIGGVLFLAGWVLFALKPRS
jgi:uncharacterized membrane protein YgdD (TMEM256/DUF423 family)